MAGNTHEIPRERWADYLNALSNREKDHPVSIRVEGREIGDQMMSQGLPLVGISVEEKGSEKDAIEVTVGYKGQGMANMTHMIQAPTHIYVEERDNGDVACLDIEDGTQVKTLIFFETHEALPAGR